MFLSWWRNLVKWVHSNDLRTRRDRKKFAARRLPRQLWVNLTLEPLEDRTLLSTSVWLGGGTTTNWTDPTNWQSAIVPQVIGDIAQFKGTYGAAQIVVVNAAI